MCDLYFLFNAFTNKKHKQKGYKAKSMAINSMYFIFVTFIISSIRLRCLEKPLSDNKLFFILLYGFWRIAYFYCLINKSGNGGLFLRY